jgi:hypothetical protein
MSLPPPSARRQFHRRRIACDGYQRDDGLVEVDAHITDVKTYDFVKRDDTVAAAGTPFHDMHFRLTIRRDLTIAEVQVAMEATPHTICPAVLPNFQRLVGIRLGKGFRKAIAERLGGAEGCTHLVELLVPIATTALQTISDGYDADRRDPRSVSLKRRAAPMVGGCFAYGPQSPLVAQRSADLAPSRPPPSADGMP